MSGRKNKGVVYKRGNIYWLKYMLNNKMIYQSLETSDSEEAEKKRKKIISPYVAADNAEKARQVYHRLNDAENEHKVCVHDSKNDIAIEKAWDSFIASSERPNTGPDTLEQYKFQWKSFQKWLEKSHKNTQNISQISSAQAQEYFAHLKTDRKLHSGTINKHIRLLKMVFRTFADDEVLNAKIGVNPFGKIRTLKRVKQEHRKELPWDKLIDICDAAKGELKLLLFLGIYTGMRLHDCCLLRWNDIDMIRKRISVSHHKTAGIDDRPVHLTISEHLLPLLEDIPSKKRNGYLLKDLSEKYLKSRGIVTDLIQDLFTDCGVDIHKAGTGGDSEKRAVIQFGFHSLRHTFVSLQSQNKVPVSVVQAIVGHRTRAVTESYTHVGQEAIDNAIKMLPSMSINNSNRDTLLINKIRTELSNIRGNSLAEFMAKCYKTLNKFKQVKLISKG